MSRNISLRILTKKSQPQIKKQALVKNMNKDISVTWDYLYEVFVLKLTI